jgi:DNA-binding NarL/FixJ family response regulator
MVSVKNEDFAAELALRAGARGYVMKREPVDKLLFAIRAVLDGKLYLSEGMTQRLLNRRLSGGSQTPGAPLESLSEREQQVFDLIGQWRRTSEIARLLNLSAKTIEYYRERIRLKLGLQDGIDVSRYATEWAH